MTLRRHRPGANAATSLVSLPARNLALQFGLPVVLTCWATAWALVAFEVTAPVTGNRSRPRRGTGPFEINWRRPCPMRPWAGDLPLR